jgi:hypothetical protein
MTVTVQAAMAGVMIVRQAVVVAQQANPPMEIIVKRGQPVVAVLKAAAARTVMPVQTVMIVQIVIVLQNMIIAQTAIPAQTVKVALKGVMIKLAQPVAANQHLVTSQPAVANQHLVTSQPVAANHLAANPPSINVQILVISQRRQSRHPIAAMMAQNAHHLPQKSASAQHGQGVMPHRRAVKAH